MPIISIDIPTGALPDVKDAFGVGALSNADAAAYLRQHLAEYVKLRVRQHRQAVAAQAAQAAVPDIVVT